MQYIILIGDEKLNLDSIKAIKHYGSTHSHDVPEIGERYCVDYGEDHIFYDYEDGEEAIRDFEKEELNQIPFSNIHTITMVYRSEERMKKILQQDNFLKGIYVDNGYNLILPIEEFIRLGMPMDTRQ